MDITFDLGGIMKLSIKTTKIVNESIKLFMNNLGSVRKKKKKMFMFIYFAYESNSNSSLGSNY